MADSVFGGFQHSSGKSGRQLRYLTYIFYPKFNINSRNTKLGRETVFTIIIISHSRFNIFLIFSEELKLGFTKQWLKTCRLYYRALEFPLVRLKESLKMNVWNLQTFLENRKVFRHIVYLKLASSYSRVTNYKKRLLLKSNVQTLCAQQQVVIICFSHASLRTCQA